MTMKTLKNILILAILGITLVTTSACRETMRGAGEDIENAGDEIQDATN